LYDFFNHAHRWWNYQRTSDIEKLFQQAWARGVTRALGCIEAA
jgi:hypothetical protein